MGVTFKVGVVGLECTCGSHMMSVWCGCGDVTYCGFVSAYSLYGLWCPSMRR